MNTSNIVPPRVPPETPKVAAEPPIDPLAKNSDSILAFYTREDKNITILQRILESIGDVIGSPSGFGAMFCIIALWVLGNSLGREVGLSAIDPPPFSWLQCFVGVGALFTTIVILVKQNRLEKMEEKRAHLELHVNLLTEQKVTKLIQLIEELRQDLPMVKDRYDAEAFAFQLPTDPESVIAALNAKVDLPEWLSKKDKSTANTGD
jgi:uncharacterized membrane protein